jgi:hypothetical protein
LRALVLTLILATVAMLALPLATAGARSTKGCRPPIVHDIYGTADHIRVTKSFPCRRARKAIRRWLRDGAPGGPTNRELRPWTCDFENKMIGMWRMPIRCKLRTSFGGTRPMRTYRLRFVYDLRSD